MERFKTRFKMRIEKSLEKIRKSRIWGTKNPSKINPKLNQNRCSQKHTIFQRFAMTFSRELQRPNLKFCAPTQCFVSFSHRSRACLLHTFWVQKTYQKPFQNEGRTTKKSTPKTMLFPTLIFPDLGTHFGEGWDPKLEPSWPKLPLHN